MKEIDLDFPDRKKLIKAIFDDIEKDGWIHPEKHNSKINMGWFEWKKKWLE